MGLLMKDDCDGFVGHVAKGICRDESKSGKQDVYLQLMVTFQARRKQATSTYNTEWHGTTLMVQN